jgi:hypothetical protein
MRPSEAGKHFKTDGENISRGTTLIVNRTRLGQTPGLIRNQNINAIYFGGDLISLWLIQSHPQPGTASTQSPNINPHIFPRVVFEHLGQLAFGRSGYLHRYHLLVFMVFPDPPGLSPAAGKIEHNFPGFILS